MLQRSGYIVEDHKLDASGGGGGGAELQSVSVIFESQLAESIFQQIYIF